MSAQRVTLHLFGTIRTESNFANSPAENVGRNGEQLLPRVERNIGGGVFKPVPVICGHTLRGRIRRAAADIMRRRFQEMNEEIRFADWCLWAIGGVKGSDKDTMDLEIRDEIIEANPILALFGAGESPAGGMVGAKVVIGHALPNYDMPTAIIKGARAAENRSRVLPRFLPPSEMEKVQLYTRANADRSALKAARDKAAADFDRAKKAKAKGKAIDDAELADLEESAKRLSAEYDAAVKAQKELGSDNSIGRPLPGYEVMPVGAELEHKMALKGVTPEQIGFMLETLAVFAEDPVVGAHTSSGCGEISASYEVKIRRAPGQPLEHIGRLRFNLQEGLVLEDTTGELQSYLAAWQNSTIDPAACRAVRA